MMETQTAFMAAAIAAGLWFAALAERRGAASVRYSLLTLSFTIWATGRGALALGAPWAESACAAGLLLVGPASVSFVRGLAGRAPVFSRLDLALCLGIPLLMLALAYGLLQPGVATWAARVWALAWVGAAGYPLWIRRASILEGDTPNAGRLRYLIFCHGLLACAVVVDAGLWRVGVAPVASLIAALPYLYVGYLILARVPVGDVRQLIGHALSLALLAGGLAGLFVLLHIWVGDRFELFLFNAFIASCALLLVVTPLQGRFRRILDRWLSAEKVALEGTLQELELRLPQLVTLESLLPELLRTLERTDRVTSSAIYLREDPRVGFQQAASLALPPRSRINLIRDPVFTEALECEAVLQRKELGEELDEVRTHSSEAHRQRARELETLNRILGELDAQFVLPLRAGGRVVGFWTLTDARAPEPFSTAELELLRSVADLAGRSIENSKTFEQVRARDRLACLGEMSAGLAHELRNPLATIRAAAEVLSQQADADADDSQEFREVIIEEIARLDRVLAAFLDYARPSTRRSRVDEIGGFIRNCVDGIARHHARDPVELDLEIDPALPSIAADTDQLERVIVNVLQNAYEALATGGRIRVAVRGCEGGIEIDVRDDGPGMDEATLERAFVPFYTRKDSGTGLGLALCERIVQAHGGTISIRSRANEGTAISIRLPGMEAPVQKAVPEAVPLSASQFAGEGA
ncbi:MAG: GAF domain-containing protein [Myxococcales bacterium]|nr:GAF domain-containing protein [Myxococcales bacterium]